MLSSYLLGTGNQTNEELNISRRKCKWWWKYWKKRENFFFFVSFIHWSYERKIRSLMMWACLWILIIWKIIELEILYWWCFEIQNFQMNPKKKFVPFSSLNYSLEYFFPWGELCEKRIKQFNRQFLCWLIIGKLVIIKNQQLSTANWDKYDEVLLVPPDETHTKTVETLQSSNVN